MDGDGRVAKISHGSYFAVILQLFFSNEIIAASELTMLQFKCNHLLHYLTFCVIIHS